MILQEIAERLVCRLVGDPRIEITGLAPIETAGPGDLTFLANPRYRGYLLSTKASAILLAEQDPEIATATLRSANPYLAFARAIALLYPPSAPAPAIHPTAVVASTATIGPDSYIGPYCVIAENTAIGARARLDAHVVVYERVRIGDDFRAQAHVTVREDTKIGHRVTLQPGVVIGGDGFGYVPNERMQIEKIIQAGRVVLADDVEIGANTTIDRAAIGETTIGRSVKIDNLVQIAHGCAVGDSSLIAAQTGLSGSTRIGRGVRIGGQVGTAGHLSIGDGAQVAAQSGVPGDVAAGTTVAGYPAEPIQIWRRIAAALPKLPELARRVRRLEREREGE